MTLFRRIAAAFSLLLAVTASSGAMPGGAKAAGPDAPDGSPAALDALHVWVGITPASLKVWTDLHLARLQQHIDAIVGGKVPASIDGAFTEFDRAQAELALASSQVGLMQSVHAEREIRDAAQVQSQVLGEAANALSLNADVYRVLAAIDASHADAGTRHVLQRVLLEYHLAGVDRDAETRGRLRQLFDEATRLGLQIERNINESRREAVVDKADELAGLPADFIAAHPPGTDGRIHLSTDPADFSAVNSFAGNADLRRQIYVAYLNRAYPENDPLFRRLFAARQQIAQLIGYHDWAEMALADQMMASPAKLDRFLDQLDEVTRAPAQREYEALLAFARTREPGLAGIDRASREYWLNQYEKSQFGFDAQSVRPYFPYGQVERGILQVTGRIFRVRFDRAARASSWDPSVSVWDVIEQDPQSRRLGQRIGRIYLDMHSRPGKDQWFNSDTIVPGIAGEQLPEGRLVCNFPGGGSDPGLMQFDDVVTFFHELGHLMHGVLGGNQRWAQASGVATELDFVEAPSQMLEEFFHDPGLLRSFARHYQTGEQMPVALIEKMNHASAFGRALAARTQIVYSRFAFKLYQADAATVDPDAMLTELTRTYLPFAPVPGTHMFASFGHLVGYSSNYYTYAVDKVIAIDLFEAFDHRHLADGPTALKYRHAVLEPGGTKPAAQLIQDFLGRPYGVDSFAHWLLENAPPAK